MTDFTRAEFDARWSALDHNVARQDERIIERLDRINGRLRETETRVAVLEDRDGREIHAARAAASRWGAAMAAVVSGAISYVMGGR